MKYTYKGKTPLETAIEFIDAYMPGHPISSFKPQGIYSYAHGVFLSGMEKVNYQNDDERYRQYINEYLLGVLDENKRANRYEGHFWASLESLDFRHIGILLVRIYNETGDVRYLDSMAELCESLLEFPVNSHGGFWHMKSEANQMWLDGLYMVTPLCAHYSVLTGKKEFADIAIKQACLMYKNMRDSRNNLLYHGWDDTKTAQWADKVTGLSSEKWGRAIGWFMVAVADIIEILGKDYEDITPLCEMLRNMADAVSKFQRESGFWCQVIDKPEKEDNWDETSATCLISYSVAKAVRLGIIDGKYLLVARKGYEAVVDSLEQNDEGEIILSGVCVGTNIETGTYEHYINRGTASNDLHGSGAFVLMCAEMNLS